jgi:hypothetical protein
MNQWKKILLYGLISIVGTLFLMYVWIGLSIGHSVKELASTAIQEYPGDRVEALMAFVDSDHHSLQERNRAVWALGRLGDERALPTLRKYYNGQPCQHDKYLCQHELRKAIRLCEGATNAVAWMWR